MVNSKAVAYEITKDIPLDILEKFRESDNPYDMETVAEKLAAEELPRWLYYAIQESDHSVSEPAVKISLYIDDETILKTAKKYANQTVSDETLTEGEPELWTTNEETSEYSTEFQQNYDSAKASLQKVFSDVFAETEALDETNTDVLETISENILNELDIFGWELGRTQAQRQTNDASRRVAEWIIESLSETELAESYLSITTTPENYQSYEDYRMEREVIESEFKDALTEANIHSFNGRMNGSGLLPKQTEFIDNLPKENEEEQEDNTQSSQIDENLKDVIDEEWENES